MAHTKETGDFSKRRFGEFIASRLMARRRKDSELREAETNQATATSLSEVDRPNSTPTENGLVRREAVRSRPESDTQLRPRSST
jgi:hypothetical protein